MEKGNINVERFKSLLLNKRQVLLKILESSESGVATVELDQTRVGRLSRMDALQAQAMSQEAMRRRQIDLANIAAALGRIDSGDYGFCMECGNEIPYGRLKIDPAGALCVDCARALEN